MFGFPILEVAIGLSFVYLLFSLICTTVNEALASATQRRGKMLANAIRILVGDAGLKNKIYSHPLIASMSETPKSLPSYISAGKFALAFMDTLTGEGNAANDAMALQRGLADSNNKHLQMSLSAVLADTRSHLTTEQPKTDQEKIEAWYNDAMDRVSGWYKRTTNRWIWAIAIVVTLAMNANTIRVAETLWSNQAVRSSVVDAASARAHAGQSGEAAPLVEYADPQHPEASTPINSTDVLTDNERKVLGELLPSWHDDWNALREAPGLVASVTWWAVHLLGWILTVIALSMGAPFWFDMLNKFMNIRNAGKSSDERRDKSSPAKPTSAPTGASA